MGSRIACPPVRQCLFEMTTTSGVVVSFSVLEDGRCAIFRDGEVADVYPADVNALARALRDYFRLVEDCGGTPHPSEALDASGMHPHAG